MIKLISGLLSWLCSWISWLSDWLRSWLIMFVWFRLLLFGKPVPNQTQPFISTLETIPSKVKSGRTTGTVIIELTQASWNLAWAWQYKKVIRAGVASVNHNSMKNAPPPGQPQIPNFKLFKLLDISKKWRTFYVDDWFVGRDEQITQSENLGHLLSFCSSFLHAGLNMSYLNIVFP